MKLLAKILKPFLIPGPPGPQGVQGAVGLKGKDHSAEIGDILKRLQRLEDRDVVKQPERVTIGDWEFGNIHDLKEDRDV